MIFSNHFKNAFDIPSFLQWLVILHRERFVCSSHSNWLHGLSTPSKCVLLSFLPPRAPFTILDWNFHRWYLRWTVSHQKGIYSMKFFATSSKKAILLEEASSNLKKIYWLTSEKGASNWLTVLPLQEHNFSLQKLISDMDGILPGSLNIAFMVQSFLLSIPLHVPRVAFH